MTTDTLAAQRKRQPGATARRRLLAALLASVAGALLAASIGAQAHQPIISVARIGEDNGGFGSGLLAGAKLGTALAHLGDLDGDGIGDLALGAPGSSALNPGNPQTGNVWIVFLNANGTVRERQQIGPGIGGFTGSLDGADDFGSSLAGLGDVDGDGIPDLAVGARRDDDGGTNRGALWILFLRKDGTVKGQAKISELEGGFAGELADQDRFGMGAGALGDFNGDGVPDVAVGASRADDGAPDAGALWLLYLKPDGSVLEHHRISATSGDFSGPVEGDDRFGASVTSLGDLDGDGVTDLAVGAPRAADADGDAAGAVWILFLAADGTVRDQRRVSDGQGGFGGNLQAGATFGRALTTLGDIDGDGVDDLAIGESQETAFNKGRVWILQLTSDGQVVGWRRIQDVPIAAIPGPDFEPDGKLGSSLAALGDHDGDGRLDLAVGSPFEDPGAVIFADRGMVRLLFLGRQDGDAPLVTIDEQGNQLGATGIVRDDRPSEDVDDSGVLEVGEDQNGNGFIDTDSGLASVSLEVGAVNLQLSIDAFEPGAEQMPFRLDVIDTRTPALGELAFRDAAGNLTKRLVELTPGTLQTRIGHVISHGRIDNATPGMEGAIAPDSGFGEALIPLGDLDGDGHPDLAVGSPFDAVDGFVGGAVWILFLESDGSVGARTKIGPLQGGFTGIVDPRGFFGSSLALLPDMDGNGVPELAVGEPRSADGGTDAGAVWILYLERDGTVVRHAKLAASTGVAGAGLRTYLGESLAVHPDLDGDGRFELVVGAPNFPGIFKIPPGIGRVWFLSLNDDGTLAHEVQMVKNAPTISSTQFGTALAILPDLDGNGIEELVVRHSYSYVSGANLSVFFLAADGSSSSFVGLITEDAPGPISGGVVSSVAPLGDADGDGIIDLITGNSSQPNKGSAAVLFLNPDGSVKGRRVIAEGIGDFEGTLQAGGRFGAAVASLGDLDGDGCLDMAVGAPFEYQFVIDEGVVWMLYLHTVTDTNPPQAKLTPAGKTRRVGIARDVRPSEDVDGSQQLEPSEDLNGNERIDQDTGIVSIDLGASSTNLVLSVDDFEPGDGEVGFVVDLADASVPGSGVVLVTDGAGNMTSVVVSIPVSVLTGR